MKTEAQKKAHLNHRRSQKGVIGKIYSHQKEKSIKRGHGLPRYSKEELSEWLYLNGFYAMWCQWVWSNYDTKFSPSPDRQKNNVGYELNNLRLVTWRVNQKNSFNDHKNGDLVCGYESKPVIQTTLRGEILNSFSSIGNASRATGIQHSGISKCCNGKANSAGGFRFMFDDAEFKEALEFITDYPISRHAHDAMSSIEEVLKHGELTPDQVQELSNVMPTLREISKT